MGRRVAVPGMDGRRETIVQNISGSLTSVGKEDFSIITLVRRHEATCNSMASHSVPRIHALYVMLQRVYTLYEQHMYCKSPSLVIVSFSYLVIYQVWLASMYGLHG